MNTYTYQQVNKDKEAVKVTFKFFPNPYFKNKSLEREDWIEPVLLGGKEVRVGELFFLGIQKYGSLATEPYNRALYTQIGFFCKRAIHA